MSQSSHYRVDSFNLRDLLLYLIPGGVVLLAFLVVASDFASQLLQKSGFPISLLGILMAYFLGHAIYPINYRLWKLILPDQDCRKRHGYKCNEDCECFSRAYSKVADLHWDYHISEVSRFRSLARFASAMIVPSILLSIAVAFRILHDLPSFPRAVPIVLAVVVIVSGLLCAKGFASRYKRYQLRFMNFVLTCEDCKPQSPDDIKGS